jgi:hypothetical protein
MENFGNIKDTFKQLMIESIINKDDKGKKLFNKFLKTIGENKTLKEQYLIYSNLQNRKFDDSSEAKEYIKENITLLKSLNTNHIKGGNEYFSKLLKGVTLVKENQLFYNDIDFLLKTDKNASNIDKIHESINNITKRMLEKDVEETVVTESIGLPPSMLANILASKFNSKYSEINETEREIIKTVLNGNKDDKKSLFESVKRECIDNIDTKLNESSDIEIKDKLLKVKDKLLNTNFDYENFNSQIGKIYNLKESID